MWPPFEDESQTMLKHLAISGGKSGIHGRQTKNGRLGDTESVAVDKSLSNYIETFSKYNFMFKCDKLNVENVLSINISKGFK